MRILKKSGKLWLLLLIPFLSGCGYNKMVTMDEQVASQWAQVENVYQRRADLIPNLVSTVKGYADFEKETLTGVIEARAKATSVQIDPSNLDASSMQQFQAAQDGFLELQAQLEGTENRIAVERKKFNEVTQNYNAYIRRFPTLITAKIFNFDSKPYFKAEESAKEVPKVEF